MEEEHAEDLVSLLERWAKAHHRGYSTSTFLERDALQYEHHACYLRIV